MKIICEKGFDVKRMLRIAADRIEKEAFEYPLLDEDMVIEVEIRDEDGNKSPNSEEVIRIGQSEFDSDVEIERMEYKSDALTGLYNRIKYEKDIKCLNREKMLIICIYIDAIGLHEINNHLGHEVGDNMLKDVADGIRKYFEHSLLYRIGGDEFVILTRDHDRAEAGRLIAELKKDLREKDHEISVGIADTTESPDLISTINAADDAMRVDKAAFYSGSGNRRRMRSLNEKLEKILQEKQDTSQFLRVIAPRFKGVYMVDMKDDTTRYIYVPEYFRRMLANNDGAFLPSMMQYIDELVAEEYRNEFYRICDYEYVKSELMAGRIIDFMYQKNDGAWVGMRIMPYDSDIMSDDETLWIFTDDSGY